MRNITITLTAYIDLMLAFEICPVEISGVGEVDVIGDELRIANIIIYPQKCDGGSTEFDELAYNRHCQKLVMLGRAEDLKRQRMWWHSHVYMATSPSGIDLAYIETFLNSVPRAHKWLISIVGNKRRNLTVRYDSAVSTRIAAPEDFRATLPLRLSGERPADGGRSVFEERRPVIEALVRENVKIMEDRRDSLFRDDLIRDLRKNPYPREGGR